MALVVKRETPIDIHTSPKELRELADRLEAKAKTLKIGSDNCLETWVGEGLNGTVAIHWRCDPQG